MHKSKASWFLCISQPFINTEQTFWKVSQVHSPFDAVVLEICSWHVYPLHCRTWKEKWSWVPNCQDNCFQGESLSSLFICWWACAFAYANTVIWLNPKSLNTCLDLLGSRLGLLDLWLGLHLNGQEPSAPKSASLTQRKKRWLSTYLQSFPPLGPVAIPCLYDCSSKEETSNITGFA